MEVRTSARLRRACAISYSRRSRSLRARISSARFFCGLGAGVVDLLSPLPCGGYQTHLTVQHGEHPAHAGGTAAAALGINDVGLAHAQRGAVVAVLGQNGKVTVDGAADHTLGLSLKGAAVRCDHRQMKGRHGLPLLRLSEHIVDGACEQEGALGQVVALAVQDHAETAQRLFQRDVLAGHTGELLCNVEALAQEALHLAGTGHRDLVLLG